jgi:PBP1b-binding outer membrane lipoprotein LpoB
MKRLLPLLPLALFLGGCVSINTHHTVDPIQINVDVNVKVDKALNDFFGDIDKKAAAKP